MLHVPEKSPLVNHKLCSGILVCVAAEWLVAFALHFLLTNL